MSRPDAPHVASPAELKERLETERAGQPFLLYREAEGQRILSLGDASERFSVGRDERMDLTLEDEQVSLLHAELHRIAMRAMDIERDLRAAIEAFDASPALRTCGRCGHVQADAAPVPAPPA